MVEPSAPIPSDLIVPVVVVEPSIDFEKKSSLLRETLSINWMK